MELPNLKELEKDIPSLNIDQYFTKEELSHMSEYEKLRFRNMKKNFEMMIKLGLPAIKPSFMIKRRKPPKCKVEEVQSSDSDEDWIPNSEQRRKKQETKRMIFPASVRPNRGKQENKENTKVKINRKNVDKKEAVDKRIYPLRKIDPPNYMKIEIPDDDEYLFCEECNKEYDGDCPVHGPLEIIEDTKVSEENIGKSLAELSIPHGLSIKMSSIPKAGLGVFAEMNFKSRTRFGPYKGEIIKDVDKAHSSGYCWQIHADGKPSHFVDAAVESQSNWLRYVNCARNESEQNLTAYQHHGNIYYRSHKEILPGLELLVWYGTDYGLDLGISRRNLFSVKRIPTIDNKISLDEALKKRKTYLNNEDIFVCPLCDYGFNSDTRLLSHLKRKHNIFIPWNYTYVESHRVTKPNNENFSESEKTDSERSKNHECCVSNEMSESEHSSSICSHPSGNGQKENQTCTDSSRLTAHKRFHTNNRRYKCDICGEAFTGSGNLTTHKRIHTNDRCYKCDICGKTFTDSGNLTVHKRIHNNDRCYKCDICGKAFKQSSNLTTHKRIHTNDRCYKCDICCKAFTQSSSLTVHKRIHTNDRCYKCDICCKAFTQSSNLTVHKRIHNNNDRCYKCDICGKTFTDSGNLTVQKRIHNNDRCYKCDICGKTFKQSSNLTTHKRIHTNDRCYKCDICCKAFTQSSGLTRHKRTHTNDRCYKCDICGKAFTDSSSLSKHKRIHNNDRCYKCGICGKAFKQSGSLTVHKRIHTNDRCYKCDICGKAFKQSSNLTVHKRIHTNDRCYKCDICGKTFTLSHHLTRHKRVHTNDR